MIPISLEYYKQNAALCVVALLNTIPQSSIPKVLQ